MPRGPSSLLLAVLVLILIAACGGVSPAPQPNPAPLSTSPRLEAPSVVAPRDGSMYVGRPCAALTSSELTRLGMRPQGRQRTNNGVQECDWSSGELENLAIYVDPGRDLLADTYRTWRGVLVPITVEGMPAALQKIGRGEFNTCTVTTGLGPKQAIETTWIGKGDPRPGNDACEFAEQATALVIRKLPPQR
ncbi:DUF3558 domain-containing protein [Actinomycetospora endophytica]|uniref:DUF3558 domain-containing protein n=1 Tax=Actinomycetospora endophytica TaxID=2291215 RepID=A0ABS8P872_9PSEU|nr:DUF3558 domain-containing protein [Actinomycetospora endophytica]MCD2194477.1 DUF3558 domain-containing protein [Actinomycetospora endophytica]